MFGLGVLLGSYKQNLGVLPFFGMAGLTALAAMLYYANRRVAAGLCVILFALFFGMWRIVSSFQVSMYEPEFSKKIQMEALVVTEPDIRQDRQMLTLRPKDAEQKILVTTTKAQEFFYGDRVHISGTLREPKVYEDFDYKGYLTRHGIYAVSSYPKILILKSHQASWSYEQLLRLKAYLIGRVQRVVNEPEASLLLGILIGARKGLSQNIADEFNETGLSHIAAVSGYNISVIIAALGWLAYAFGRRGSAVVSAVVIIVFVLLAGPSASVIRAAVMGGMLLIAFSVGRPYAAGPAIFAAGAFMLFQNPKILFWDAGFQLSFAATLGIVYGNPLFLKLTERLPDLGPVKTTVITTLSASLATLPFILYHFGRLSFVVIPANLLVLPIVPAVMLFGFLCLLPVVGAGFAMLVGWLLDYILFVTHQMARLPFASVNAPISAPVFWVMLAALVAGYAILNGRFRAKGDMQLQSLNKY